MAVCIIFTIVIIVVVTRNAFITVPCPIGEFVLASYKNDLFYLLLYNI